MMRENTPWTISQWDSAREMMQYTAISITFLHGMAFLIWLLAGML